MEFEKTYQEIMLSLSQGGRGFKRLREDEIEFLVTKLGSNLTREGLKKTLCLIEHSQSLCREFEPSLLTLLQRETDPDILVFLLNCARRHIIEARFQQGHRLDFSFLEILKKCLSHSSPLVVEWTLRTIDECGPQGIFLAETVKNIKPPFWTWFNPHQRAVRELSTFLCRKWKLPNEKSRPST